MGFRVGGSGSALVQDISFNGVTSITDEVRVDLYDNVTVNNSNFYRQAGPGSQLFGIQFPVLLGIGRESRLHAEI